MLSQMIGIVDSTIVNIALPDITTYFHKTLSDTSWISTIYMLSLSVFMITASKLADQFGRKKTMLLGLTLFGASSALCGSSHSLIFLISMRFIQGTGGAIITPVVVPMEIEIFGNEKLHLVAAAIDSAISFILFIAAETKIKSPLIEIGLFKEITFTSSCLCYMIAGITNGLSKLKNAKWCC